MEGTEPMNVFFCFSQNRFKFLDGNPTLNRCFFFLHFPLQPLTRPLRHFVGAKVRTVQFAFGR